MPAPDLGQSGGPKARRGIVHSGPRVRAGSLPAWTRANCEAGALRGRSLPVFSLGKAARGSVVAWSPDWTGPLSDFVVVYSGGTIVSFCSSFIWRDHCHAAADKK